MRIGLPRALSYYEYAPLWRAFFEALGAQVVVSGPTTRATLEVATTRATADLCFPAKVYVGHLLALADRVDLIFVPSLRRPAPGATHCAKIVGLPDLARSVLPEPSKILEVDLDLDKGRLALAQAVWAVGRPLTWNPVQIARAAEAAWGAFQDWQAAGTPPSVAGRGWRRPRLWPATNHDPEPSGAQAADPPPIPPVPLQGGGHPHPSPLPLTLAVVGHPYLLQDKYVNYGLLGRLQGLGVRPPTPDMLPAEAAGRSVERLTGKAYWAYAPMLLGAGGHYLESGGIDGLLAVVAFGCAPDSGLAPVLSQAARRARVPMLTLTLDEHSGEAGLVTRLEAFVDMLSRKRIQR
jgi:predicted nucleotide-binding protein (sugar kinase/HSP70/actin superfamily)